MFKWLLNAGLAIYLANLGVQNCYNTATSSVEQAVLGYPLAFYIAYMLVFLFVSGIMQEN